MLIIFALFAAAMIGVIATGLDYGFATDQHRNLQAFVDQAATAGAAQLATGTDPNHQQAARTAAFIYFRDALFLGNPGATSVVTVAFMNGTNGCHLTSDVISCTFPAPYDNYTISIYTPSDTLTNPANSLQASTVSVHAIESVTSALGGLIGIRSISTGAVGIAGWVNTRHADFALYTDRCVNFGGTVQVIGGDVYSNQCGVQPLVAGQGGFCATQSSFDGGSILLSPGTPLPSTYSEQQRPAAVCEAATAGSVSAFSKVTTVAATISGPAYSPPPTYPTCVAAACVPANATNTCTNGTRSALGLVPNNCYNPGAYSTIDAVANNLNPGVYYLAGDQTSACYTSTTTSACPGATFTDNTLNANFGEVMNQCWLSGCADGFQFNPTSAATVDPQCKGSLITSLAPPSFSVTATLGGGLSPGTYYIRVTALNAMGETAAGAVAEKSVILLPLQGGITVNITPEVGATGYRIYGPLPQAGTMATPELQNGGTVASGATLINSIPSGTTPYPLFDTTSCTGFRNIPRNQFENRGVTFVLAGKASICDKSLCQPNSSPGPTAMLSPYCSKLPNNDLPSPTSPATCPYAISGTGINDGAYTIYGAQSQGSVQVSGGGAKLGLTGTVYGPNMALGVVLGAQFELIPGQAVFLTADLESANLTQPLIIWNGAVGALLPAGTRLLQ